jgi:uncharacterized protein YacL
MEIKIMTDKIIDLIKKEPTIWVGFIVGVLFGTWISSIVSWIPLIGTLIAFMSQLIFGVLGGLISLKLKNEYLR